MLPYLDRIPRVDFTSLFFLQNMIAATTMTITTTATPTKIKTQMYIAIFEELSSSDDVVSNDDVSIFHGVVLLTASMYGVVLSAGVAVVCVVSAGSVGSGIM